MPSSTNRRTSGTADCRLRGWAADAIRTILKREWTAGLIQKIAASLIGALVLGGVGVAVVRDDLPWQTSGSKSAPAEAWGTEPVSGAADMATAPGHQFAARSTSRSSFVVPPCDRNSGTRSGANTGPGFIEACRTMIEDAIANYVKVVERRKLDAILEEMSFQQYSGLADTTAAVKIGKMVGADFMALGTIMNESLERKSFSGYGIRTKSLVYNVSLRLRVVDVESGEIVFSKTSQGTSTEMSSRYGGGEQTDGFFVALRDAVAKLNLDSAFKPDG